MHRYKAVFFDAGMTLIQPNPNGHALVRGVLERYGLAVPAGAVQHAEAAAQEYFWREQRQDSEIWASDASIKKFWRGYYRIVLGELGLKNRVDEAAMDIYDAYNIHENWTVFPDVVETLDACRHRGMKLGVISDWGGGLVSHVLGPLGLTGYFDFMLVSATMRAAKPSLQLFRYALDRAGVAPPEAMHVGDSYLGDVLGARGAGITPVLIDRRGALGPVDCIKIKDLRQILELLDGKSGSL
jgi:putative hydrolase of the HAD superfamily